MLQRIDHMKESLIERTVAMVRSRLEPEIRGAAERLLRAYYADVPPEDILHREPDALYGAAMALFNFARTRAAGKPNLRIYHPRADEGGWDSPHSVVEMVNDDMPFLVDSVAALLEQEGVAVHLLIHPILPVRRDAHGHLQEIAQIAGGGAILESLVQIEIDRQSPERAALLTGKLASVLASVREAVADWRAMRERALLAAADLEAAPGPAEEKAEAREFLHWLHADNFTFLGAFDLDFGNGKGGGIAIEPASRLGILRNPDEPLLDNDGEIAGLAPSARRFLQRHDPLIFTKSVRLSRIHRAAPMDVVIAKRYDSSGGVVGLHILVGLMGAAIYSHGPTEIPLLRRRVAQVVRHAGFRAGSHDGRALQAVLEAYPRDELLQADDSHLFQTTLAVLRLQERRRTALFLRRDEFDRFTSALVYVPRDRYDTTARLAIQAVLEEGLGAKVASWHTEVGESPLARLHFMLLGKRGAATEDAATMEARLAEVTRSWSDRLHETMIEELGEEKGLALFRRWGLSFPASYREVANPRVALADIGRIEAETEGLALNLFRPAEAGESEAHFKIYRRGDPVLLSDVLPIFENLGFRVIAEEPHILHPAGDEKATWIHDFDLVAANEAHFEIEPLRARFEAAFRAIWQNEAENDGFNRLVLQAGLDWRQAMLLRAYSRYLRQTGANFSPSYVERSIVAHPDLAALLVRLFETRFDPAHPAEGKEIVAAIEQGLDKVSNADEDRIIRRFLDLVECTLRTNHYQPDKDGRPKPYLSFKLDSRRVQGLPLPRPMVEIFVYSPRMDGLHLRGGKVARGGIRWSDRPEDFRTEILGLMKAQTVKNVVIVPVGSKGGFVVKRPSRDREAFLAEGVACYRILISGLLDLTDNYVGADVVPLEQVVRRDGDDPYLVVAADKGTATFSDIANGIAGDYGYWLGDAFASGGSVGYDHKAMGITARGAWESVKRHFREIGLDTQNQDFTVVGVGDMSGDVFGNGMMRSAHIRLLAAFDHRHIFLDPDPDIAATLAERTRLFALPRSSWADFDATKISKGGGVFPRDAKQIALTPEIRALFGIEAASLTPAELIQRLLAAEIDLLWFGGIGTYVKASYETQAEAGDRANDALRVNGSDLRCRVVGEGANLAVTQLGRVEAALAGRRLNTDAIDNSAGVDTSDHEVNIKILLDGAVADGDLTTKKRNALLAAMTDELGLLVLRDNYLQTQAISLMEAQATGLLDQEQRFMHLLERAGKLDRGVEFLPSDEEMTRRLHAGRGLTRPEISVMLAYGKIWLYDAILESDLPDDPLLFEDLVRYFPKALRTKEWRERMTRHRLRREIIATSVANSIVNRIGGSAVARVVERSGTAPEDVARAYLVVRDAFELREVWGEIEALDNKAPAEIQTAMLIEINRLIGRGVDWVLGHAERPLAVSRVHGELAPGIATVRDHLDDMIPPDTAKLVAERAASFSGQGVPKDLAKRVAQLIVLTSANDISRIAARTGKKVEEVGRLYFLVAARFEFGWLRQAAEKQAGIGHWATLATDALIDDLYSRQAALTATIAADLGHSSPEDALAQWIGRKKGAVGRADELLAELKATGKLELASLIVATHQLHSLSDG